VGWARVVRALDRISFMSAVRGQFAATVVGNDAICREHFVLRLGVRGFPPTEAGQFVQLACHDRAAVLETEPRELEWEEGRPPRLSDPELLRQTTVLRRPFSLAGRRELADGSAEISIIHRVVGIGTTELSALRVGDVIDLIGPLGNTFQLPPPSGVAILVGGGAGIPPMLYLADYIGRSNTAAPESPRRKAVAFFGALCRDLLAVTITDDAPVPAADGVDPLYNIAELQPYNTPAVITTDDGSYGYRGLVTQALVEYLDNWITDNADRARTVIYTCGPEAMMKAVAEIAQRRQIACQVAIERAMACGMSTCQSCVIRVAAPNKPDGWRYALACTEGPVFDSSVLRW
ncbi:MAG TPA: hypothetical protein PKB10_01990, partial [Tepidisphaeraceae bacterium]|nr:hypothetical protein [Tepidisphaeraceae bacterium]